MPARWTGGAAAGRRQAAQLLRLLPAPRPLPPPHLADERLAALAPVAQPHAKGIVPLGVPAHAGAAAAARAPQLLLVVVLSLLLLLLPIRLRLMLLLRLQLRLMLLVSR